MSDRSQPFRLPLPPKGQYAKRACILDAAQAVFCREGFAGASIDLIAAEAGVSRQTVYNHHGDKENLFIAVVREMNDRCSAGWYATLAAFPDRPKDLEAELVTFAVRLTKNCMCNRDGKALRTLIQVEGTRYPELFKAWREFGPGKSWSALGALFAKLAHGGYLEIRDPDLAARQFMALVNADLSVALELGNTPTEAELEAAARNAVRTFLKAFGPGTAGAREDGTTRSRDQEAARQPMVLSAKRLCVR